MITYPRTKNQSVLGHRGIADQRREEAEELLRELAFVFHLVSKVREEIGREAEVETELEEPALA